MTRHSAICLSLSSRTFVWAASWSWCFVFCFFFKTAPWSYVYWFILQNPILEVAKAVNIVKEWVKHQTVYEFGNESIQKTAKIPLANVLRSIKLCASAQMQGERFACLSLRLHCFTRWCWVMVHARWFPVDVEQWQPSVKIWWEWKGPFVWKTGGGGVPPLFSLRLKAYHTRAEIWHHHFVSHLAVTSRATRSVTQRLPSPSVDLNSNMSVSAVLRARPGATARKYILFIHLFILLRNRNLASMLVLINGYGDTQPYSSQANK